MERLFRIPLIFLFIASLIGVLLRIQMVAPLSFVNYSYFLHGHSHIMFLGWVFNVLYLAFVVQFIAEEKQKIFRRFFWILQIMNIGMLIAFPIQGYGMFSIIFSTAHTIVSFYFILLFFKSSTKTNGQSLWLAKISLLFFMIASIGPFSLAYIMANHLQHTHWYNYSIYFYLHFQYNGFFFFGIASLFVYLLEQKSSAQVIQLKPVWRWLAFAMFPTYLLSILYSSPGFVFNTIGMVGAIIQLVAFAKFLIWTKSSLSVIKDAMKNHEPFLVLILSALMLKFMLQLASAAPSVARMTYELRPVVIAYLHLVLIGIISIFLLVWFRANQYLARYFTQTLIIFLVSFIIMEFILVLMPWWPPDRILLQPAYFLLGTAGILSLCCLGFVMTFKT